jgi:hypothetical protein
VLRWTTRELAERQRSMLPPSIAEAVDDMPDMRTTAAWSSHGRGRDLEEVETLILTRRDQDGIRHRHVLVARSVRSREGVRV